MKMPGKRTGPKYLSKKKKKTWGKRHVGGNDLVSRVDRQSEVLIWCRKMLGLCESGKETKNDE